jgi:hypothetical protein
MVRVERRLTAAEESLKAASTMRSRRLCTAKAAAYADCDPETIRRAHREGLLTAVGYVGNRPRFTYEGLDRWMAGQRPKS